MQNKNRGAAMVEFALVVPFFFMLMMSIIYGALVMHDINSLNELTRAAVRYGAVQASGIDEASKKDAIIQYIKDNGNDSMVLYKIDYATGITVDSNLDVKLGNDSSDAQTEKAVSVTVTAKMVDDMPKLFMDYFPADLKNISSTLTMRRED